MQTQTTTKVDQDIATDLDSLDASMDRVYSHFVDPQQGATTDDELFALSIVAALCGYAFPPKVMFPKGAMSICPKCRAIRG
jgi:hypothetical protein